MDEWNMSHVDNERTTFAFTHTCWASPQFCDYNLHFMILVASFVTRYC
jgi:hypothetical protein